MENPSENDTSIEDQNKTAGGAAAEATTEDQAAPEGENSGLISDASKAVCNEEALKDYKDKNAYRDATVSDAVDDAWPDDDEPDVPEHTNQLSPGGLPLYKYHKTVEAFKIAGMESLSNGELRLIGYNAGHTCIVGSAYVDKHHPMIDGYYVRYHYGYQSWSPAEIFESGYTIEAV